MMMNLKQRIGLRVKLARQARGLTQAQLAEAIGKAFETVSNIERGKTAPSFETLHQIAIGLDLPLRDFFDEEEDAGLSTLRLRLSEQLQTLSRGMSDAQLKLFIRIGQAVVED